MHVVLLGEPHVLVLSKITCNTFLCCMSSLSFFFSQVKRDPADDVFLTYEELAFWNLHYKIDSTEQLKPPPKSSFLSLKKKEVGINPVSA